MSCWTHVAAIIRIDGFHDPHKSVEEEKQMIAEAFGKECLWGAGADVFRDANEHPEKYLPMGSEGSLQMSVWVNPCDNHADRYTVSIFGDLRDVSGTGWIISWFKKKLESCKFVRQATITVDCEYNVKPVSWTYGTDDEGGET